MTNSYDRLYHSFIIEQYKSTRHRGILDQPDFDVHQTNPLCGDSIHLTGKLVDEPSGQRLIMRFEAKGCVISQASATIVLDQCAKMTFEQIRAVQPRTVLEWLGMQVGPTRQRCVLLIFDAVQQGLVQLDQKSESDR